MTSEKQIEANRRNALKSTGPKTGEGKAASKMNALQHGLTAEQVVLPHEDPRDYDQIRAGVLESYDPAEQALVEELVNAYWRLLRLHRVEARYWDNLGGSYNRGDQGIAEALIQTPEMQTRNYFRYYAQIEKSYYRALAAAKQIKRDQISREKPGSKPLKALTATGQNGFVSHNGCKTETATPNVVEFPAPEPAAGAVPQNEESPAAPLLVLTS